MTDCRRQRPTASRHAWVLLVFAALPAVLLPAAALRTRTPMGFFSMDAISPKTANGEMNSKSPLAFLISVPRGGSEESAKSAVNIEDKKDIVEEENPEPVTEVTDTEDEELVEEVAEEVVEATEAEDAGADEGIIEEEEEESVAEEEDEEVEVDVFSTEEIPSDDVRSFHTTDGELADDEGVYTDGQNESPIADNEAAADTIAETEEPADSGSDEDDGIQEEGDLATETATAIETAASVTVIDDALKKVLMTDLRYTQADVSQMRPEIAAEVVRNQLMRPTEGMPKNWYIDPVASSKKQALLAKKKRLFMSIAAVGVAALSFGVLKDNDTVGDTIEEIVDAIQAIPRSLVAAVVAAKNASQKKLTPKSKPTAPVSAAVAPESETTDESSDEDEITDTSIHSIKPGTTPEEVPDPEVDHTWLDKMLTRMGVLVKSFFNAKI